MKIRMPGIREQQRFVLEEAAKEAITQLQDNLKAPVFDVPLDLDESQFPNTHLLREREGWGPPDPAIVRAYFSQFQSVFTEFDTDKKMAGLLGLSSDRRVREFKNGDY